VILKRENLARKKILAPQRAASQFDLDQATAELAQSEASVSINAAMVDSARANLDYCKIIAPVDGIVVSRKVDRGQTVIAAMNTPVLFTIAQDLSKMNIDASVSEADMGQVREGQLRKECGAVIANSMGIFAASRALRHSDIRITSQYYADKKVRITTGLDALLAK
jgi:multidrug efflux pump subunit AcrA (membrane-fusion protein)